MNQEQRPTIGITPSIDKGKRIRPGFDYIYLKLDYIRAIEESGARAWLLPPGTAAAEALTMCNALLISGGGDIPILGGQGSSIGIAPEAQERIDWERRLIDGFVLAGRPIFGVCYGLQLLNFHFGGTLWTDIPSDLPKAIAHGGLGEITEHTVMPVAGSFLEGIFASEFSVSSAHHQAVRDLAPDFKLSGYAPDNIPEAIESDFAFAVEWHPESDHTRVPIYSFFSQVASSHAIDGPSR